MITEQHNRLTAQGTAGTMLHFRWRVIPIPKIMLCFKINLCLNSNYVRQNKQAKCISSKS